MRNKSVFALSSLLVMGLAVYCLAGNPKLAHAAYYDDTSDYESVTIQTGEVFEIPRGCEVENWCLVKATPCKLLMDSRPQGLYRTSVKYSVVRRAWVTCQDYYGSSRRVITGPVEPIYFESTIQSRLYEARTEAFDVCERYRADWVEAAPTCR